jgi:phosphatidylethanolamine-binding protein (PEBP) family uncharacterized protein
MRRPTPATPRPGPKPAMGRGRTTSALLALLAAIVLGGCANESTTTNSYAAKEPSKVPFGSSAVRGTALPALYTCDGKDISPPMTWGAVPSTVEELALFVISPVTNKRGQTALAIEWAMAGIKPKLHSLRAGEVPRGAFLLATSKARPKYSICPPKGHTQRYSFALFALPPGARASAGLPSTELFRNLNRANPGEETPATGVFTVSYTRR